MEQRNYHNTIEVRESPTGGKMITGYGIVFNSDSEDLGGFIEQVDPGAVTKTLQESDIRGVANHNTDWTLGRVKSGTMRLYTEGRGVRYEIDVNENDPDGQRALAKVQRGDWDGSSFCFETIQEAWDWDARPARRRLLEIKIVEMGPVAFPAYPDSTATARGALRKIASKLGQPVERMVEALKTGEIRSLITEQETDMDDRNDAATETRAVWSTAYINDLPDSAFLYVEDGEKDSDGKTTPRTKRHFPYKDANGKVDLPHLRNALARIPDSDLPQSVKDDATAKAKRILADNGGEQNSLPLDTEERVGKKISAATADALRRAMAEIQNLLGEMEPDGEPDNDGDEGDMANEYDPMARTLLSAVAEIRSSLEPEPVSPLAVARARLALADANAAEMRARMTLAA